MKTKISSIKITFTGMLKKGKDEESSLRNDCYNCEKKIGRGSTHFPGSPCWKYAAKHPPYTGKHGMPGAIIRPIIFSYIFFES
jgi:hypothetical protein